MKQVIALSLHQSYHHHAFFTLCEETFEAFELEFIHSDVGILQLEVNQMNRLSIMKSHLESIGIGLTGVIGYQEDQLLLNALDYAKIVVANEITYLVDVILLEMLNHKSNLLLQLHQTLSEINHENIVTAKAFLENDSNALLASESLYVHRNTFSYRMMKLLDQSNIDLRDFHCARLFQLWLTLRKTLK